ncbi:hypothetical protein [Sorangium sp. So ce854]|uniref:hypothetical protein n=1 Tax=Sorangium sp. So ce854 TaxID=3133322 RepID=UPI003F624C4B
MHTTQERSDVAQAARSNGAYTADGLLKLGSDELLRLYRGASAPRLRDISGDTIGKLLMGCGVTPPLDRWLSDLLRETNGWNGKTFRQRDDRRGDGFNRMFEETRHMFPFNTYIGRSRAGDFDALQLDYDVPENPSHIRAVKDEIRELSPGLYLGQAYVRILGRSRLACYFSLVK